MWQGLKVKAIDLPNVLGCLLITDTRPVLKQRGRKREREEKKKKANRSLINRPTKWARILGWAHL